MKIRRVGWTTFRLPFRQAFATAHGTLDVREGLILRLTTEHGLIGLGEASPMPGFGGSLAEARATLRALAPRIIGRDLVEIDETLGELELTRPSCAAVAFALDTAVHDLRGRVAGLSIARLLGGDPDRLVRVHATVGAPTTAGAVQAAREAAAAGFCCVKLKVGFVGSTSAEIARIEAVREAIGPGMRLRLDANESWSVAEAVTIIKEAERFDLDLVEQPVDRHDLIGMAQVRGAVETPIAADEAVGGVAQAREIVALGAADILVVKPMLAGGLRAGRRVLEVAGRAGLGAFVTTTLESGIGVAAALHLAATLRPPALPCGLATGPLLVGDLLTMPLAIVDGAMRVPSSPGLGVTLDEETVRGSAGPWQEVGP